jgi:hypothetical protein
MPRPEEKPPTEGGRALKTELVEFVDNSTLKNEAVIEFLIDKIAELKEELSEVKEQLNGLSA